MRWVNSSCLLASQFFVPVDNGLSAEMVFIMHHQGSLVLSQEYFFVLGFQFTTQCLYVPSSRYSEIPKPSLDQSIVVPDRSAFWSNQHTSYPLGSLFFSLKTTIPNRSLSVLVVSTTMTAKSRNAL